MNGWLAALRIARREARRAKGRSSLVVALIGLPVMALAFAAVTYASFDLTTEQEWERRHGTADALVSWPFTGPADQAPDLSMATSEGDSRLEPATAAELLPLLPPGSRITPHESGWLEMRTATGVGGITVYGADPSDPLFAGRVTLLEGRSPAAADEVALNPAAAERLGAGIGDTVQTAAGTGEFTVVGQVEFPGELTERMMFRPDEVPEAAKQGWSQPEWLWSAPEPVSWEQVRELNQHGILVKSLAVLQDPPPDDQVTMPAWEDEWGNAATVAVMIGGLGTLEVVLLAGPAFAVGARNRQRALALVAANGGTPAQLRRIVLADGVVLGLIAAVVGTVLGVSLAAAGQGLMEEHLWRARAGGFDPYPLALLGIAGLAVITGVLAALVPAVLAARQSVVQTLAGRRGVVRSRRRWWALGIGMIGLGAILAAYGAWQISTNVALAGLIIGELGLVLCTPALIGLISRWAGRAPLSARIALRDTARNRSAAAPAISAVMAAVAGALALIIFLEGDGERWQSAYTPALPDGSAAVTFEWWDAMTGPGRPDRQLLPPEQQQEVRATLESGLETRRLVDVSAPMCPDDSEFTECGLFTVLPPEHECPFWTLERELTDEEREQARADERCQYDESYGGMYIASTVVIDETDTAAMELLTGAEPDDIAAAAAVLADGGVVVSDPLTIRDGEATLEVFTHDESGIESEATPVTFTAPGHALETATGPQLLFISPEVAQRAELVPEVVAVLAETTQAPVTTQRDALDAALREINSNLSLYVESGPSERSDPTLLVLTAVAGVIALGAAGIATGLAAADRRADLSSLAAVGASPRVRRLLSLSQSGVIAGLGTLLGILAGTGAAVTLLYALNQRLEQRWPPENPYPIEIPWISVALLLAVPLVAMAGAGLLTRSRLPIERRLT